MGGPEGGMERAEAGSEFPDFVIPRVGEAAAVPIKRALAEAATRLRPDEVPSCGLPTHQDDEVSSSFDARSVVRPVSRADAFPLRHAHRSRGRPRLRPPVPTVESSTGHAGATSSSGACCTPPSPTSPSPSTPSPAARGPPCPQFVRRVRRCTRPHGRSRRTRSHGLPWVFETFTASGKPAAIACASPP